MKPWLALIPCLGLSAGCVARDPTELMIDIVNVDLDPGTQLVSVQVQAFREGSTTDLLGDHPPFPVAGAGRFALPGSVAIIASNPDDPRRVTVNVTANLVDGAFTLSYSQAFAPGVVTHLVFPLAARCATAGTADCPNGTICGADGCAPAEVFTGDGGVADGCQTGFTACNGSCVNLMLDSNHCGTCDTGCAPGLHCVAAHCELSATCEAPTAIALEPVTTIRGHVSFDVTHDSVGCGTGLPQTDNAYVTFTLPTPEIIALETDPSDENLRVGFVDGCATAVCSADSGCGTPYFERLVQVRAAGPQVVVASQTGMGNQQWAFTIRHYPVPAGTPAGDADRLVSGPFTRSGGVDGAAPIAGFCSGADASAVVDHVYWFQTCANTAPAVFTASTCGSPGAATTLQLDTRPDTAACVAGTSCGAASMLSSDVSAAPGLHLLYVTSPPGTTGSFVVTGTAP